MAQNTSNLKTKTVFAGSDTVHIDSLSLVPNALKVVGNNMPIWVDDVASKLVFLDPTFDSIAIQYRVLPLKLDASFKHKDTALFIPSLQEQSNPFSYQVEDNSKQQTSFSNLEKRGSLSRGVNFGNNQNLGVNSNLNLQLSGQLTERIQVLAAISDQNIPIQPDGNTQQLQDFDQVYIQLFDDYSKLTAGDFELKMPKSYFMQYQKRLRGISAQSNYAMGQTWLAQTGVSAAVSRGKFSRNIIQGVEGNQGPYRLRGAENEQFIILLSGTENVYIDGRKLTRGQEHDYIVDYNNAEITFTAKQMITKDKRIVVEFQYASQAYSRSLIEAHQHLSNNKLSLNLHVYSEQDAKNQALQQDLTEEQKEILRNSGNNIDGTFASGVSQADFRSDRVLYKLILDTFGNLGVDSIYVYSTNPDSARYQLRFTDVGAGRGNYVQVQSAANGQVFQFVSPLNGVPQGRFEPIVILITPKRRQMVSLGGEYILNKNNKLLFEGAFTNNDLNTYSNIGNSANQGNASKLIWQRRKHIDKDTLWAFTSQLGAEHLSKNFSEIERFRSVEFDRDWNIRDINLTEEQWLPSVELGLHRTEHLSLKFAFDAFLTPNEFKAYKNSAVLNTHWKGFDIDYKASALQTEGNLKKSNFLRHNTFATKRFKKFTLGFRDDLENNIQSQLNSDSLSPLSYSFYEWEVFIANADSAINTYKLSYNNRVDYGLFNNEIDLSTRGEALGFEFGLLKNPINQLKGKVSYRTLQVGNDSLYSGDPEENLLSRLEYDIKLLKGGLSSSSFYEIGSGLEERREFVYIEVAAGQGLYTWNDYNNNGIKELNEFEVAVFRDQANYIRISVPTNDFTRTYSNQFNQVLFLQPERFLNKNTLVGALVSRFANQVAFRVQRKTLREENANRYNPFYTQVSDTALLNTQSSFRNSLFFNRSHPIYGVEYTFQQNTNKNLQTNGLEAQSQKSHQTDLRIVLAKKFQMNIIASTGEREALSAFFENRNYLIEFEKLNPKLSYQPSPQFVAIASYAYTQALTKELTGEEKAFRQQAGLELKINQTNTGSLTLNANAIWIDYNAQSQSPVAYELLEGLLPGVNGTWEAGYQRTLGNNLQLNVLYTGRKSEQNKAIHSGSVQVRAFF